MIACSLSKTDSFLFIFHKATYPLDLTKTRLQIQGEGHQAKTNGLLAAKQVMFNEWRECFSIFLFLCFLTIDYIDQVQYRGMVATCFGIVREEGALKLWQGVTPALYRHVVYRYLKIALNNCLPNHSTFFVCRSVQQTTIHSHFHFHFQWCSNCYLW